MIPDDIAHLDPDDGRDGPPLLIAPLMEVTPDGRARAGIEITLGDESAIFSPSKARAMALQLMTSAALADSDLALYEVLTTRTDLDGTGTVQLMQALAAVRQKVIL